MSLQVPTSDDRKMWDLHLSTLVFPSVSAALEIGLFEELAKAPGSPEELAQRMSLNPRGMRALIPMLAATGLLEQRVGRFQPAQTARDFLMRGSPFHWGPVFAVMRKSQPMHDSLLAALRAPVESSRWDAVTHRPTDVWSEGSVGPEMARMVAEYMQANSLKAAAVAARVFDLSGTRSLLDVGAGSGCFAIAFANANPHLRCTVMDLPAMCDVALGQAAALGVGDRLDAAPVDMFRMPWPTGHDALFFSNVFHDWDFETCAMLARKSFEVLPSGGRILLHEALYDDSRDGPVTVAAFSLYMLIGTKGQQFTAGELAKLLGEAGFRSVGVTPGHAYHAIVSAIKP